MKACGLTSKGRINSMKFGTSLKEIKKNQDTDKSLGATKPSILSINDRQLQAQ